MKTRITVNNVKISYYEDTDEVTFKKGDTMLTLKMGEDNLNVLYKMTPYTKCKKWLYEEQNKQCATCGKDISYTDARLHHEPKLGREGAKYIDFKCTTQNKILCTGCH